MFQQKRWDCVLLLFTGVLIVYTLRVNMSVAISKMVDDLNWSEGQKGFVLSSFYIGYALGQMPSNRFVMAYGGKLIFGLSVLVPSILTFFVPFAARTSYEWAIVIRILIGLTESASFPAIFQFFQNWVPLEEKTLLIPSTYSGIYMGEIIGFSLSGILVDSDIVVGSTNIGSWPSVFYVFALMGVAWYPFWCYFAYESPSHHPTITMEELKYIQQGRHSPVDDAEVAVSRNVQEAMLNRDTQDIEPLLQEQGEVDNREKLKKYNEISNVPWMAFFQHSASLTLLFCSFVYGFVNFLLLSELPSYFKDVLGFDVAESGVLAVIPYTGLFISVLYFGYQFNRLKFEFQWSVRTIRQTAMFICFIIAPLFLIVTGYIENVYVAYMCITIAQAIQGAGQSGTGCNYLDICPRYSSNLNSVGNTFSAIAGIIGPIIVSAFITALGNDLGWKVVFFLTSLMCLIAMILWYLYQTSEVVPVLNSPRKRE